MRVRQTITQAGTQAAIGLDWMQTPFDVYYSVEIPVGTTATGVTVQHCSADLNNPLEAPTAVWIPDTVIHNVAVTTESGANTPTSFVECVVGAISGGPMYFEVIQGMSAP